VNRLGIGGGKDPAAVRVALGVVAIGVIDDAFVRPEPGTSASDHLASGLAPVMLLVLFAVAYPRLRPGLRGACALIIGVLAVVAGALGSVTALLAAMAGVWLSWHGVATLWRSRRLGSRPRRYGRRAALSVAGVLVTAFVVVPIGVAIVATHRARDDAPAADLGRPYERTSLETADGLKLAAWYVPSRNRAAVIVLPGRTGPLPHARMLVRHGYGVLLFDRRGEGASDGDFNALGWEGEADVRAAIDFLERRPEVDPTRIGGLGLSVGGEMLLQTAAHDPRLCAVVSEGAGARSLGEQLEMPHIPGWRRPLSPWVVQTMAVAVLADAMPPTPLGDLARTVRQPLLLIQARRGHEDEQLNVVYQEHAGSNATRWLAPGGHTGALAAAPSEYERRVVGFLDQVLS
jgi:predicted alpha/beta hydrolase